MDSFSFPHTGTLASELKAIPYDHIVLGVPMLSLKSPLIGFWNQPIGLDSFLSNFLHQMPLTFGSIQTQKTKKLLLSNDNRTVTLNDEKKSYPKNPERFDNWKQVVSTDGLTGRSYWEVEWEGRVQIAVAHKAIKRSGAAVSDTTKSPGV